MECIAVFRFCGNGEQKSVSGEMIDPPLTIEERKKTTSTRKAGRRMEPCRRSVRRPIDGQRWTVNFRRAEPNGGAGAATLIAGR